MEALPTHIKAGLFTEYGSDVSKVFKVMDIPMWPFDPESDQVVIKSKFSSVNPVDWKIMCGYLQKIKPVPLPMVLFKDGSGVVVRAGAKATGVAVGDEVWYDTAYKFPTLAEYVVASSSAVGVKPQNLTMEEAGSQPCVALTGLQALVTHGGLRVGVEGQKVLIIGGAGGVGSFSIQYAKNVLGAFVATTASERNEQFVRDLGADQVINYRTEDFAAVLAGQNYDLVFDAAGEKDAYARASGVLKDDGVFISITGGVDPASLQKQQKGAFILTSSNVADLNTLRPAYEEGKVRALVDTRVPFKDAADAIRKSMEGKATGKIVVEF